MYEAFYGLTNKPFQLNPDPNFYFGSKQHRRARAYLEYGVSRNEGFIVIIVLGLAFLGSLLLVQYMEVLRKKQEGGDRGRIEKLWVSMNSLAS